MARRIGYTVRQMTRVKAGKRVPTGRWQVLVRGDHGRQVGLGTYGRKADAERAGHDAYAQLRQNTFVDPRRSDIPLSSYMRDWRDRKARAGEHGDKYADDAERMQRLHIDPTIGRTLLTDLQPGHVSRWLADLRAKQIARLGAPGLVPSKTYRLLHACLEDAKRQRLVAFNPCMEPGAAAEHSPERPLLTPEQVAQLAASIPARWSALVLTAAWAGLRFGEAQRLERSDVDLLHGTIRVRQAKSRAGVRTVHLPKQLVAVLDRHLATFVFPDPDGLVFTGDRGGQLSKNFTRREFRATADMLGHTTLHFHDLRHYAGTMTAVSGATQREIMARLGHASPAAAMRYQHAAEDRAAQVAEALDLAWVEADEGAKVRRIRG